MKIIFIILLLLSSCNKSSSNPNDDNFCTEENSNFTCWDGTLVCDSSECLDAPENYPDWDMNYDGVLDNYNDYQNNGSITSAVFFNDINYGNQGDMLAAFVDDELRGVAIPTEIPFGPYINTYQFLMMIYSNLPSGEILTFKFYDSETDVVYYISGGSTCLDDEDLCNEDGTVDWVSDMTIGNLKNPVIFTLALEE